MCIRDRLCLFVKYVFSFSLFSSCHFLSLILTQDSKRLSLSAPNFLSFQLLLREYLYCYNIQSRKRALPPAGPTVRLTAFPLLRFLYLRWVRLGYQSTTLYIHSKSGQVSKHSVVKVCRLDNFSEETYHECTLSLISNNIFPPYFFPTKSGLQEWMEITFVFVKFSWLHHFPFISNLSIICQLCQICIKTSIS